MRVEPVEPNLSYHGLRKNNAFALMATQQKFWQHTVIL